MPHRQRNPRCPVAHMVSHSSPAPTSAAFSNKTHVRSTSLPSLYDCNHPSNCYRNIGQSASAHDSLLSVLASSQGPVKRATETISKHPHQGPYHEYPGLVCLKRQNASIRESPSPGLAWLRVIRSIYDPHTAYLLLHTRMKRAVHAPDFRSWKLLTSWVSS